MPAVAKLSPLEEMQQKALASASSELSTRATSKWRTQATVVNIGEFAWTQPQDWGAVTIPARPEELPYGMIVIPMRNRKIDIGLGVENMREVPMDAWEMAWDVCRDLCAIDAKGNYNVGRPDHGVFVCEGDIPTPAELDAAHKRVQAYYRRKLNEGDTEWGRTPRHENIDDVSKRAARYFGEKRPWAYEVEEKSDCPFCAVPIKAGSIKCPHCTAIVDPAKAFAAGIIDKEKFDEIQGARKALKTA